MLVCMGNGKVFNNYLINDHLVKNVFLIVTVGKCIQQELHFVSCMYNVL